MAARIAGKPLLLMILDGWGMPTGKDGDSISLASLPNFWYLWNNYPHTSIGASGPDVGLPPGQMGDSEVGHMSMGSGRILHQDVSRINNAITDGSFNANEKLLEAVGKSKKNHGALHLFGLFSDGGIHSHINHLLFLLRFAARENVERVYVHCFGDGRDTNPHSLPKYLKIFNDAVSDLEVGEIATIIGRYYAMDRDKNWERVEKAYNALVYGKGEYVMSPLEGVERSYASGKSDEFIKPLIISDENGKPKGLIKDGDTIIFFNYRSDRAREITRAFCDDDFPFFERGENRPQVNFYCMTKYDDNFNLPVLFSSPTPLNTLSRVLANNGLRQLRIAETEKYAHVTFFFSGGIEKLDSGEDRVMIPSPNVKTYDSTPEMSCLAVTKAVIDSINGGVYDVIVLNFANPDMLGHTGNIEATVKSIEIVDSCIGQIEKEIREARGALIITADHGNVEKMQDEKGQPFTSHTTNAVPFILVCEAMKNARLREDGRLEDIAPTILQLLNVVKPEEMSGKSLILSGLNEYSQLSFNF